MEKDYRNGSWKVINDQSHLLSLGLTEELTHLELRILLCLVGSVEDVASGNVQVIKADLARCLGTDVNYLGKLMNQLQDKGYITKIGRVPENGKGITWRVLHGQIQFWKEKPQVKGYLTKRRDKNWNRISRSKKIQQIQELVASLENC